MVALSIVDVEQATMLARALGERAMGMLKFSISPRLLLRPSSRRKRDRDGLPLLLPSSWPPPSQEGMEVIDSAMEVFREISDELLLILHQIQLNLLFWRAQGSDRKKIHYMLLERGPRALVEGVASMFRAWMADGSFVNKLLYDASCRLAENVAVLMDLQREVGALLAQVYEEVHILGSSTLDRKVVCKALANVHKAFGNMEKLYTLPPSGYYGHDILKDAKARLIIDQVPGDILGKDEWSDSEIEVVIQCLYKNLANVRQCTSFLVSAYRRPNIRTRYWIKYTAATVGAVLVSGWLFKHSRLAGSDDLDKWSQQAADAVKEFYMEHVEEPLLSIRDDLFETFRKRHQGAADLTDVRLTAESLSRMLKAFAEQTNGGVPPGYTDQQLVEIMMNRYEKELMHPIQNLLGGELVRALLIQVQKLKLDIETAMLELNQILRANEINFAILAAFPALLSAFSLVYVVRLLLPRGKGAEGRGRAAQQIRRMLVTEAERALMRRQSFLDDGQVTEALWQYGMVIYALDRLYRAVSSNRISSEEWLSLREDILDLAKPSISTSEKLVITARMVRVYECLIPVPSIK